MEVNKLKLDIESKDQILAQRDQSLKRVEKEQIAVVSGFKTIREKMKAVQTRMAQLNQEKEKVEGTLEQREMEFQALKEYTTTKVERQQWALSQKQEEIASLRKNLAAVRNELERMKSQLPSFQKELQKVALELAKKSTEVLMLREAKEEMKLQLEVERKRIDGYLMQQTAVMSSCANYGEEVKVNNQTHSSISSIMYVIYIT